MTPAAAGLYCCSYVLHVFSCQRVYTEHERVPDTGTGSATGGVSKRSVCSGDHLSVAMVTLVLLRVTAIPIGPCLNKDLPRYWSIKKMCEGEVSRWPQPLSDVSPS